MSCTWCCPNKGDSEKVRELQGLSLKGPCLLFNPESRNGGPARVLDATARIRIRASWLLVPFLLAPGASAVASGSMPGQPRMMHLDPFFRQNDGRLRLSRQGIIFKNSKTGKVDNIQAGELTEGIWRRVALGHGLKLLTKNGHVYKYDGFRESVRCPLAINPLLWCHLVSF